MRVRFKIGFEFLHKAQVRELGRAVGRHQNVVRFHVAVHQSLLVGLVQRLGDLRDNANRLRFRNHSIAFDALTK